MSNNQNENDKEFLKSLREQLYIETFEKDVSEYSHEKIETLVKMIDLEEGNDEQEAARAQVAFEKKFREMTADNKKKNLHTYFRKIVQIAAVMLVIILLADTTTQAVMDESLFRVLTRWTNQITIRPGRDDDGEMSDFQEYETQIFTSVEEFAAYFNDDFLVCTWLPEGIHFERIDLSQIDDSRSYVWKYCNEKENEIINIRIYKKIDKDIAGLTGTQVEDGQTVTFANGISGTMCVNNGVCLVAFEYNEWWYLIYSESDENILKLVVEGMVEYE